ncbi:MAG: hypothetical protein U0838_18065 [Chloroflexota bacterium]
MSAVAAIRPDQWDLPLFLHVLGALTLVGALALCTVLLTAAWRQGSPEGLGQALRALTLGALPAWIVLRVSAEWIFEKEGYNDVEKTPTWLGIGYMVSDVGFLLIVVAGLLGWFALRRARADGTRPSGSVRVAAILVALLVALNVVALWAMTTKPG